MKKRVIALSIVITMIMSIITPVTSEAAPPWVNKFLKVVLADVRGGLDGWDEGGTLGSALGEAVDRSIAAGISSGQGLGSPYNPPRGVKESIGLHHNLALKEIIGDKRLSDLTDKDIDEGFDNYLKQRNPKDRERGKTQPKWVYSKDYKKKTSIILNNFTEETMDPTKSKDLAVRDLRNSINPEIRDILLEMDFQELNEEINKQNTRYDDVKELKAMNEIKYNIKGKIATAEDIGYMIGASILEYSFDFWGGNDIDLDDDYIPQKIGVGGLGRFWRKVKADLEGFLDGYGKGPGSGIVEGAISSKLAGIRDGSGQGNWNDIDRMETLGSLHNKALVVIQGAEDQSKAMLNFLKEHNIEIDKDVELAIKECNDPKGCTGEISILDWLNKIKTGGQIPLSGSFGSAIEDGMDVLFNEERFDEVKVKQVLQNILDEGAKASGSQARILNMNEYKAMEAKLKEQKLPYDIIYASIFVDVYLHSTAYWLGEIGPINSLEYVSVLGKHFDRPEEDKIEISLQINNERVLVNGKAEMIDVKPIVRNGRTLVPLRFIGEALKAEIDWIQKTQEVTYELGDMKISLFIDDTRILVNGVANTMDVAPVIVNQRTLVPVRMISETLGFEVEWDQKTQTVHIFSK